ncbi:MAG: type II toxin-antitoxin system prevent-host-death family antitoxin [Gammaproteobacteria bacterium]|nr:type II toxin-antitoxin system prevent-host-death family antitoxin [Gammaproteobacteria bacterium]MDP2140289.1 type II toxin-antitoxin system prevent-host-death family antitoxin [Gammaproteobacteria bacterium]MDP2346193.1 type II toxin-antitoxin system prevent-host-death family antitoxin [Gammaproteobacteria bacterium]
MQDVNVTNLRQNLPEYLARVEAGETLRVTVHGRAIAEISPPSPLQDGAAAARIRLRNSVVRYDAPLTPVLPADEWDMLK